MQLFQVNGGRRLHGSVRVSGAKNAALPIMAACLLTEGRTTLENVPRLADVETLALVLDSLGMQVVRNQNGDLELKVYDSRPFHADYQLVRRMRASFCVLGPLLARRGRAVVSMPGGCNIGDRPVDLHLKGLRALGADIRVEHGYVVAEADRLRGTDIYLGGPFGSTVTGTCNVLSAAVLAEGTTTIEGAACEPEVADLGYFLCAAGARIEGLGTPLVRIEGVESLEGPTYRVVPDRIEAATLMIAAAITGGEVVLENARLEHMTAVVEALRATGVGIQRCGDTIRVTAPERLRPIDCTALPYPGLPTDVQAQMMALLCLADGMSIITDKVFPDRFMHAAELSRLGATIRREGASAIINGARRLSGASVMASDLRASAALVLAGLAAEGTTTIRRIYHLDRGYERLEQKLSGLGASIQRLPDESAPVTVPLLSSASEGAAAEHGNLAQQPHAALRRPKFLQSTRREPTAQKNRPED